nr:PREDICTED: uncharacterized protein LOC109035057 [Bemisia tabaci]
METLSKNSRGLCPQPSWFVIQSMTFLLIATILTLHKAQGFLNLAESTEEKEIFDSAGTPALKPLCGPSYESKNKRDRNPFIEAVESSHFVDKTPMIKFFHRHSRPLLVTAPRDFGKTTNLYMLKTFYEIKVDESGIELDGHQSPNRNVFNGLVGRKRVCEETVFDGRQWCDDQMASYPVLHYSFENLAVSGLMDFLESFRQATARVCKEHASYLLKSDRLTPTNITLLRSYCDAPASGVTRQGLCASGRDMSAILAVHFGRPSLVLLDELDAPVLRLLTSSAPDKDVEEILAILKEFSRELFVDNPAVGRAFLTGNTKLATTVAPPNAVHWQFTEDEEIAPFFGFSDQEVEFLVKKAHLDIKDVREYYKGYHGQDSSTWLYNPYSIRNYLRKEWTGVYWSPAMPLTDFAPLFKTDNFVRGVFSCGAAVKEVKVHEPRSFTAEEQIGLLREMIHKNKPVTTTSQMVVLVEFLYELGYFTNKTVPRSKTDKYFSVKTPNKEVSEIFYRFCEGPKLGY